MVALTGHLGAGKTTVLNHILQQPGVRVGVVINDFGDINVDAALVCGQVDEPVSIAGGCLCCLLDNDALDDALATLAQPRLDLDVIIVEASGIAEPAALSSLIRFSTVAGIRPGGVVEVVDALEYFATVDTDEATPPSRFRAASLVVINKCDRVSDDRDTHLARIERRIRLSNPDLHIVHTESGRLDPALLFDAASTYDPPDQLPFAAARRATTTAPRSHAHAHASAVTVQSCGPVDPGQLIDLLENPPEGAYRIKGQVTVATHQRIRGYVINLVGRSIHIASTPATGTDSHLVAIGHTLDTDDAQQRLQRAIAATQAPQAAGYRRLQQYRRLSA